MFRSKFFLFPRVVRRFRDEEKGTTAIEFAILGGPFFLLIFAIIESSLYFFAGQYLETTVDDVARMVRTGQLGSDTTQQQFRDTFCAELVALFNCAEVRLSLETAANFIDLVGKNPPMPDPVTGELAADEFVAPAADTIIQVTAQVKWPVYTNFSAPLLESESGNFALLQTVSVTRTEQFE